MTNLFSSFKKIKLNEPLAQRLRPTNLSEIVGQKHLLSEGKLLKSLYESGHITSLILWGPPGVGKTTIARLLTQKAAAEFVEFSAVLSGVKEVREVVKIAQDNYSFKEKPTVLFVDEIHRFNKAQQDAFLPHVENGLITLIGATTENPSFEIIPALISRMRVLVLESLTLEDLKELLTRVLNSEEGLAHLNLEVDEKTVNFLLRSSGGDARALLNALELAATLTSIGENGKRFLTLNIAQEAVQKKAWRYDKGAEEHYNLISALHKSMRDSDPDGAIYWLARMLDAGEDPYYLLRRMLVFASEDVGLADPAALMLGTSVLKAFQLTGAPEGELFLAHFAIYLATAEKSNSAYAAFNKAKQDVREFGHLPVPMHIRNAPTSLMKDLGYGASYQYAHDYEEAMVKQEHLPDELLNKIYYEPNSRGREKYLVEKVKAFRDYRRKNRKR